MRKISKSKLNNSNNRKACTICNKMAVSSNNRPNSLHKTKRTVKPNLQKHHGQSICTSCLKNLTNRV